MILLSGSDHRELLRAVLASCCGSIVGRVSIAPRPHLQHAAARHFPVPVTSLTGIFPFSHPLGEPLTCNHNCSIQICFYSVCSAAIVLQCYRHKKNPELLL
ncbi:hypothetical protein VPH35_022345 [Triticum aestivum]